MLLVSAFAIALIYLSSCSNDTGTDYFANTSCNEADDSLNTYTLKIKSILNTNCAKSGCHNAASHEAGRDYSTYASASSAFDNTALCTIYQDGTCKAMPENAAQLPAATLHDLTCWAKNGYPQ